MAGIKAVVSFIMFLPFAQMGLADGIKVCPADAKHCPDGATVSRDPENNCEFTACPVKPCEEDAKVCPDGTKVGRDVDNNCEFTPCPDDLALPGRCKKNCSHGETGMLTATGCICAPEHACCEALSADCLSCSAGQTVGQYCAANPETFGCPKVCTADAKQCPDGATVSRDPENNCEFTACPVKPCEEDAKVCPDGTSVGRDVDNNCEFKPCPGSSPKVCTADAKQCPDGATVSRDPENNCEFTACPVKPCEEDAKVCPDGTSVGRDVDSNCEFKPCPGSGSSTRFLPLQQGSGARGLASCWVLSVIAVFRMVGLLML